MSFLFPFEVSNRVLVTPYMLLSLSPHVHINLKSTFQQMWATKRDAIKASGADIMAQLSQAVDAQGAHPAPQAAVPPHHMHAKPKLGFC